MKSWARHNIAFSLVYLCYPRLKSALLVVLSESANATKFLAYMHQQLYLELTTLLLCPSVALNRRLLLIHHASSYLTNPIACSVRRSMTGFP